MNLMHAYIVSSPDVSLALLKAKDIAMEAVCRSSRAPCRVCPACKKVIDDCHPDVQIIRKITDDKGNQKKEILIGQIRNVVSEAVVLPNESEKRVFIIHEGDDMNTEAQNAALKLLEEPPEWVILIITARNPNKLLPTVRSRCGEINVSSDISRQSSESEKMADEYLNIVLKNDEIALFKWCEANNSISSSEMEEFAQAVCRRLTDILCYREKADIKMSTAMHIEQLFEKCSLYLKSNAGVKTLFGMIEAETF